MILTITLNPAIDISYYVNELKLDNVNRCDKYIKTAGGKGINVTKVLRNLNCNVMATGFLGGSSGEFIKNELKKRKVDLRFVDIAGETRNCIAIVSQQQQTEILESGPFITEKEETNFIETLKDNLDKYPIQVVTASGSIPKGLSSSYYTKLIKISNERGIKFLLDTSGIYLHKAIEASPYLIKPNISELEGFYGKKIDSLEKLINVMEELRVYNIQIIVVSLGKEGCIALCDNEVYKVTVPQIKLKNPVGSGDAMVAGMGKGIENKHSYEEILKIGSTCGTLNAMNEETGAINIKEFQDIYNKIKVEKIKRVSI
ncbi:1-phosphofructokinase [Natronincola ferrireducens]|uniref:Tagatose-6-phosphate kinase n=1 Tax=Natronincola ferrireducens TaxID=393762 RepID=A0A1G8XAN3_9FIRM|nr:1-phosphofructokinase [Natronincola ferrireducens]SDJ86915.1 tagatose 6-phosphate kinase [Natronincola ferrireducens]